MFCKTCKGCFQKYNERELWFESCIRNKDKSGGEVHNLHVNEWGFAKNPRTILCLHGLHNAAGFFCFS